jgi:hypothetical protein
MPEQDDERLVEGVGCPEDGVHQGLPDPVALVLLPHPERAEAEHRLPAGQQRGPGADHVPDGGAVQQRDEGERTDPRVALAQRIDQPRLDRLPVRVHRRERLEVHVPDGALVPR